jgi:hypothetical protein
MRLWADQSSRPSIRAQFTGSQTSCSSPPSLRPAPPCPHQRNQGSARACTGSVLHHARRFRARGADAHTAADCSGLRKPLSPHLKPSLRPGRSCGTIARQSPPTPCPQPAPQAANLTVSRLIYVQVLASKVSHSYQHLSPLRHVPQRRRRHQHSGAGTQSLILLCSLHPIPHSSSFPNFFCRPPTSPPRCAPPRQPPAYINPPFPTDPGLCQV